MTKPSISLLGQSDKQVDIKRRDKLVALFVKIIIANLSKGHLLVGCVQLMFMKWSYSFIERMRSPCVFPPQE